MSDSATPAFATQPAHVRAPFIRLLQQRWRAVPPLIRLRRILIASMIAATVFGAVLTAVFLGAEHRDGLEAAGREAVFRVRLLEEHARRTLDSADVVVRQVLDPVVEAGGPAALARWDGLHLARERERLRSLIAGLPQIGSAWVIDAEGRVVLGTTTVEPGARMPDVADRDYFQAHRTGERGLYVGPAVRSRITGQLMLTISRRVETADGRFAGVVGASLPVSYFTDFYRGLGQGDGDLIVIHDQDDRIILSEPPLDGDMVRPLVAADGPAGTAYLRLADEHARALAWQPLQGLPLTLTTGVSLGGALASWRATAVWSLVLLVGALVAMGALTLLGLHAVKRADAASRDLARLSETDALTGIANRRHFDRALQAEWHRGARTGQPLSLLMIDVDAFKTYNDTYGHQAGDEALRRVAAVIESCLGRPGDLVARYGGEELVVLMPCTDLEGAGRIAATVRDRLRAAALPHAASPVSDMITVSIGGACRTPDPAVPRTVLVEEADRALYGAKRSGRDRAVLQGISSRPAVAGGIG